MTDARRRPFPGRLRVSRIPLNPFKAQIMKTVTLTLSGVLLATSALITSNSLSSLPAMPTSVTYLPFTTTAGVPVIL